MKKLTKLFSAIAMLSVLALFGCSNPNNTSTDNSISGNSTNLDGYYTITSRKLPSPTGTPTPGEYKDDSIYVMKNNTIYFRTPNIKFILQADKTIKAYMEQIDPTTGESSGTALELTGNWKQTDDKLVLTASIQTLTIEYTLAKNNDISWPSESDFAKLDGTYTYDDSSETTIKDGKFNYIGEMPVVLKADGTLTFTNEGKEYSGYWFMKNANTLSLSVSEWMYCELIKK